MKMKKSEKEEHGQAIIRMLLSAVRDVDIWMECADLSLNDKVTETLTAVKVYMEEHDL